MNQQEKKDKAIAAGATLIVGVLILFALFFLALTWDPKSMAQASTPEIAADDEELFIEPEILDRNLQELGEENATEKDEPAPQQLGEPEKAPEDNSRVVVPGKNPNPAPQKEPLVSQKKDSPVKTQEPSATEEEKQKVTSSMAGKFSGQNGNTDGKNNATGAGGTGSGYKGNLKGRKLISCPMPSVKIQNKTVVTVTLRVNEEGHVVGTPTASGGGSKEVQQKCIAAARQARWEAKKGAGEVVGTITFTIVPR